MREEGEGERVRSRFILVAMTSVLAAMFLVSRDDSLHQRMPNDIALGELDDADAFDAAEDSMRFNQSGMSMCRQIDLRLVAGNYCFGIHAEPSEEHEHLFRRRILRFVEDDERVVEGAPAH